MSRAKRSHCAPQLRSAAATATPTAGVAPRVPAAIRTSVESGTPAARASARMLQGALRIAAATTREKRFDDMAAICCRSRSAVKADGGRASWQALALGTEGADPEGGR